MEMSFFTKGPRKNAFLSVMTLETGGKTTLRKKFFSRAQSNKKKLDLLDVLRPLHKWSYNNILYQIIVGLN